MYQAKTLKIIAESIRLKNYLIIDVSPEGLGFKVIDDRFNVLATIRLNADEFQDFKPKKSQRLGGVLLRDLNIILKCADINDMLTMECKDEFYLTFTFERQNKIKISKFTIKFRKLMVDEHPIIDTKFSNKIELPSSKFTQIITTLDELWGLRVRITSCKKSIKFGYVEYFPENEIKIVMEFKVNASGKYEEQNSIDFDKKIQQNYYLYDLKEICMAERLSNNVILYMDDNKSLVIEYKIGDSGELKFFVAAV
jgi:proliferating cell nuclear antigen PCNA